VSITQLEGPVLALALQIVNLYLLAICVVNIYGVHRVENPGLAVLYEICYGFLNIPRSLSRTQPKQRHPRHLSSLMDVT